jgi:putative transposase
VADLAVTAKRELVQALVGEAPVRVVCRALGLAPSSYYYAPQEGSAFHAARSDGAGLDRVGMECREVLAEFPTYGYRRLTAELGRRGHLLNHKRVQRILQQHDLARPAPGRVRTTDSQHPYGRFPNLLQGLEVLRPEQVWCADITYIRLRTQFVYLAIVLDVSAKICRHTRGIRGWALGASLASELACTALRRALERGRPEIHHSDQGIQYAATGYTALLHDHEVQLSMAGRGRPTDNPYAERVLRTIKEEEVYLNEYRTLAEARIQIGHFIDGVYNQKRIHSALGYLTPAEYERQWRAEQVHVSASPPLGG